MVDDELKELQVRYHPATPPVLVGVGCTGRAVGITVTTKAGLVRLDQRAMDEISTTDQYWTAHNTTVEWD